MKKIIIILILLIFIDVNSFAQSKSETIDLIDSEITKSINNENYERAAKLKKEKDLLIAIDDAVKNEDYEKASNLKKELNNLKSPNYKTEEKEAVNHNSIIMKNGFFINGSIGGGTISSNPYGNIGLEFGNKWYFGNNKHYRPGIQVTWVNFNFFIPSFTLTLSPVNVGFSNLFEFKQNYGLEVNIDAGYRLFINTTSNTTNEDDFVHGVCFNPEVKFRYKRLAVGVEANLTTYLGRYGGFIGYPAFTIGGKF